MRGPVSKGKGREEGGGAEVGEATWVTFQHTGCHMVVLCPPPLAQAFGKIKDE